ncbi:MAG: SDR family NAD(P)-dependent oxidoreductase [Gemmatimonadaceae bacterium]|jgi:3-oxoacyl-[acyl-carrier protein] reductase|nr:SDR family NAD(P)-dependent oxidoreductase [Gemmatimonadaceae bacterium]
MSDRPVALITGASRGIGRAIALRLAPTHRVVAAARDGAALAAVVREIDAAGGAGEALVLDVADPEAVARALAGRDVDVLVHNAGVGVLKPLLELEPAEWQRMIDVNVNALYHVTRALLPGMVARGRGHVVIIGSIAGRSAFVGGAGYATTKHAVMGFAESLMLEVRDAGVKVSVVNPGSVDTGFSGRGGPRASAQLAADDVAAAVHAVIDTPAEVLLHRVEVRILSPKRPRG